MLFRIDGSRSFLLGSFHFTHPTFSLPSSWKVAYRNTEQLIFEARLDEQPTIQRSYMPPASLKDDLPDELVKALSTAWTAFGRSPSHLIQLLPWAVILEIGISLHTTANRKPPGVDGELFRRAKATKRPIKTLESINDGLASLGNIDPAQRLASLKMFAADPSRSRQNANHLYSGWMAESPDQMLAACPELTLFPDIRNKIFTERNIAWLPTLLEIIKSNTPSLVVAGALHFVGPESIPELLKAHGITCTHVPKNDL